MMLWYNMYQWVKRDFARLLIFLRFIFYWCKKDFNDKVGIILTEKIAHMVGFFMHSPTLKISTCIRICLLLNYVS